MKILKFAKPLPSLILEKKKNVTWRINDDKNIKEGDELSLCNDKGHEFTKAEVINLKETTFEKLTGEDKKGHEKFSSNNKMYKTYSKYYDMNIKPKTKLKVIRFKILEN